MIPGENASIIKFGVGLVFFKGYEILILVKYVAYLSGAISSCWWRGKKLAGEAQGRDGSVFSPQQRECSALPYLISL